MIARHARLAVLAPGLALAFALGLALAAPDGAMAAGDAATGEAIARQWCAGCHGVAQAKTATDAAPTLAELARRPGRTPEWWRGWLIDPHPPMPNPSLSRQDIDHVTAYLQSLRQ